MKKNLILRKSASKTLCVLTLIVLLFACFCIVVLADDSLLSVIQPPQEPLGTYSYFYNSYGNIELIMLRKTENNETKEFLYPTSFFGGIPRYDNITYNMSDIQLEEFIYNEFDYWLNNYNTPLQSDSGTSASNTYKSLVLYYDNYELTSSIYYDTYYALCYNVRAFRQFEHTINIQNQQITALNTQIATLNNTITDMQGGLAHLSEQNQLLENSLSTLTQSYNELESEYSSLLSNFENEVNQSYESGYMGGYNQGMQDADLLGIGLNSIFSAPSYALYSIFNFEIFGINVLSIVLMLISVCVIAFVIKRFI